MPTARRFLPPIQSLQAFEAVARLGSFTEAATELALTQSAISRQVSALERQLGVALLLRGPRHVVPTAEGASYASAVRGALGQLHHAALALQDKDGAGTLTLAILPTFGTRWLIPRLPRFLRAHPEITLHFVTRIGAFDMGSARVDAAIHAGRADWPATRATLLLEDRVQPLAAPQLARGLQTSWGPDTASDIARLPRLALASRPQEWAGWMAAQGLPPPAPAAMVFEHLAALAQACAAGLGVALMPPFLFRTEIARGELCPLAPDWANGAGYWLMEPDSAAPKRAVADLRTWLVTECSRADGAFA
ncbi:MAG: LysR family transcriptional regulator [Roseinatronobacter sp.]|nr:LysR family transcriptional regulator [Roseinatronobacter sp.]